MKVNLWLLEKECSPLLAAQAVHDNWKNLAHAIAYVDEVNNPPSNMDPNLERVAFAWTESPDLNFAE